MANGNSFILYTGYRQQLSLLPDAERGQLVMALMDYVDSGIIPELPPMAQMAFSFIQSQIDQDKKKYQETVEKRRAAGSVGGRQKAANAKSDVAIVANARSANDPVANATYATNSVANLHDNDYDYVNDKDINTPPTPSQEKPEALHMVEQFLAEYPKVVPSAAYSAQREYAKAVMDGFSENDLIKAVKNYAEAQKILKTSDQFIKNPDNFFADKTFFGYLPGQYHPPEPPKAKTGRAVDQYNQFMQNSYDYDALEQELLAGQKGTG